MPGLVAAYTLVTRAGAGRDGFVAFPVDGEECFDDVLHAPANNEIASVAAKSRHRGFVRSGMRLQRV
jgi:hypothetical protein